MCRVGGFELNVGGRVSWWCPVSAICQLHDIQHIPQLLCSNPYLQNKECDNRLALRIKCGRQAFRITDHTLGIQVHVHCLAIGTRFALLHFLCVQLFTCLLQRDHHCMTDQWCCSTQQLVGNLKLCDLAKSCGHTYGILNMLAEHLNCSHKSTVGRRLTDPQSAF